MSNPSSLSFFYLQRGPLFTDDYTPTEGEWTSMYDGHCVVPESVSFEVGSEPGHLAFHVYVDSQYAGTGVYPPKATMDSENCRRPDGVDGALSLPVHNGSALLPFTMIRLREATSEADISESDPIKFEGVLLTARLDLATETWVCTALETPRWRMSRYTVKQQLWHNTNLADEDNPMVFPTLLPVFNNNGSKDMWVDDEGNRILEFYHEDYPTNKHWRFGDMLNYLRKCWWTIDPDTGLTILGVKGLSKYVNWPEATEVLHSWLFTDDTDDLVLGDVPVGAMTLLEAVDTVVRKAGRGSEWTMQFDAGTQKWDLQLFDRTGLGLKDLSRGRAGADASEEPDISEGSVGFDWTQVADNVTVFGQREKYEVTIGYDPDGSLLGQYPLNIQPTWDAAAETAYMVAELAGDPATDSDYPGVYVKFKFDETVDWDYAFHGANTGTTKQGQRQPSGSMVTKFAYGTDSVEAKVWRWTDSIDGTPHFKAQPESVGVIFNEDGSFSIHGYSKADTKLPVVGKTVQPRYLCFVPAGSDPWTCRPFVLVLTVYADERSIGNSAIDPPADWPTGLEDCPDLSLLANERRYRSLQFVDSGGLPIDNNPSTQELLSPVMPEVMLDVQKKLYQAAKRRRSSVERPSCSGEVVVCKPDWAVLPGYVLETLTGGITGESDIPLPQVTASALIRSVTFSGLGTRGSNREQRIEINNG